jgi:hypothetical protein
MLRKFAQDENRTSRGGKQPLLLAKFAVDVEDVASYASTQPEMAISAG